MGPGWMLAGSEEMQIGRSSGPPQSRVASLLLEIVGQELGWLHADTIAQYWTAPLGHLVIVTGVKWAIRSARSHPWLCKGSSVSLCF